MNLNTGKVILEKYPELNGVLSRIYNFISFNSIKVKGKNNKIITKNSFMKKCNVVIQGRNNKIIFGDMCYLINSKISIYGDNNEIILDDKVYVNNGDFYLEDSNNKLKIGKNTTFSGNTHLALTEGKTITIGPRCLFSSNVVFRTGDSHSILNDVGNRINLAKDIEIEEHVWFSQNTTILKGVKIKKDSIVATGSIVTKEINVSNVILAGNPAKIIKENINWNQERI